MSKPTNSKTIFLEIADQIATVNFDRPESSANIFDQATLDQLDDILTKLENEEELEGVIFASAKDRIFLAGADIKTLSSATEDELDDFLWQGQQLFNRIAQLKVPTVAAIHGVALGGGLELALACDWRVASKSRATKVGLPETQLGILPAWGGSTRLPKLIGLPKALDLILKGSTLNAAQAKGRGIIDGTAPRERLLKLAHSFLKKGKRKLKSQFATNNFLSAAIIDRKVSGMTKKKTRGRYPAQEAAIDVVCESVNRSEQASLSAERKAALELARSDAARNLMRIFFLTEAAKSKRISPTPKNSYPEIKKVCVVGAGVMGAGIAHWLSTRGIKVILQDINAEAIAKGLATAEKLRAGMLKRRMITPAQAGEYANLITTTDRPISLTSCDMVIEAAVENLEIKKKIFTDLSERTRLDCILATNTSALPISELAAHPEIKNPERIVGLHFFNPVHRMKLVEVVSANQSDPGAIDAALRFTQKIGKLPVLVYDSPGFVVNRILMPYLVEAGDLFDRGVDAKLIDDAMLDFGMPMGPIRLLDEIGLDVARHVTETMKDHYPDRCTPPAILDKLIEKGHIGRKSGAGFYLYDGKKGDSPSINPEALEARSEDDNETLDSNAITDRLSLLMINEACRCLEEGVCDEPDEIDLAMIMGAGFAPFRGGPMNYVNEFSATRMVEFLKALREAEDNKRFECSELLLEYAKNEHRSQSPKQHVAKKKTSSS